MKWMIASDIHGSVYYCKQLLDAYRREGAERLLLLGDLLYHGPRNGLTKDYDPKVVSDLLNAVSDELLCVRGNCDSEVDQMMLEFPILAEYCVVPVGGKVLFATHGHHFNEGSLPKLKKGDILLNGHFHIPACTDHGDYIYMNPGSVTCPKEDTARGYILLEDGKFTWKTLEGESYMEYKA